VIFYFKFILVILNISIALINCCWDY